MPVESLLSSVVLPRFVRARQRLADTRVADPRAETRDRLLGAGLPKQMKPGDQIAITAGSRGMGGFAEILDGICDAVRSCGGHPFLVPAMGSHGGATAEGQSRLLNKLGITPETVPVPVRATMETRSLGECKAGAVAHLDTIAAEAQGIIVLGRIKTHPENKDGVASGLLKMTTIGLGNQEGAQEAHSHGLWPNVEAVPEITLAKSRVLFGVAVVENAFRHPAEIEIVPGTYAAFRDADQRLLDVAKRHFASIPFDDLDLLVVDEIGKNVSGTGMDLNVVGEWRVTGGERQPNFRRIVVLSLTPESCGNGLGIGLADFTTTRFMREFDFEPTYINLVTATEPGVLNTREGAPPLALPNDRAAILMGLRSSLSTGSPRICRIRSTAALHEMWISESIRQTGEASHLEFIEGPEGMQFDRAGNLF